MTTMVFSSQNQIFPEHWYIVTLYALSSDSPAKSFRLLCMVCLRIIFIVPQTQKNCKGNTAQSLCVRCVVRFFGRLPRNSAGILPYGKGFLGNMTENLHADCVQSRQAGFVRCCPRENLPQNAGSQRQKQAAVHVHFSYGIQQHRHSRPDRGRLYRHKQNFFHEITSHSYRDFRQHPSAVCPNYAKSATAQVLLSTYYYTQQLSKLQRLFVYCN